jgi:hypothetical protein
MINLRHSASRGLADRALYRRLPDRAGLEITQSAAAHDATLQKNTFLEWRITDLEQRTARLVRGAGNADVNPY